MNITPNDVVQYGFLFAAFAFAITIHEYAHARVAFYFGDDTAARQGRLSLNPLVHLDPIGTILIFLVGFGWGRPVPVTSRNFRYPKAQLWISLAGPASNLIVAFGFGMLIRFLGHFGSTIPEAVLTPLYLVAVISGTLNLYLCFFNLIPLFPLDGSHIVENLLPTRYAYQFVQFGYKYGAFVLLGLVLLSSFGHYSFFSLILRPPAAFLFELFSGTQML